MSSHGGESTDGEWSVCPPHPRDSDVSGPRYVYYLSRYGPTQVIQFGFKEAVTDVSAHPFQGIKRVLFFIPGNPGSIVVYKYFLMRLHQSLGIPVIGLSHVGMIREGIHRFKAPLTVRKLVEHKVDFIDNVIPPDVEIVLCGHSLGTFVASQIMRLSEKRERFVHSMMLMPVFEKLSSTPGWKSLKTMINFRLLFYVFVMVLSLVKDDIVLRLMPYLISDLKKNRTPDCVYEGILQMVDWRVIANMFQLSQDEVAQIQERDDHFLRKNVDKLSLFYTVEDRWVPLTLYRSLKRRYQSCFTELMDTVSHSFVMDRNMTEDVVARILRRYHSELVNKDVD